MTLFALKKAHGNFCLPFNSASSYAIKFSCLATCLEISARSTQILEDVTLSETPNENTQSLDSKEPERLRNFINVFGYCWSIVQKSPRKRKIPFQKKIPKKNYVAKSLPE